MDLYTLTLPLNASAGATLRDWLTAILEASAVACNSSREIVLAAVEAVNNAVRHSAPEGTTVIVTMNIVGRDVFLRVTDREKASEARTAGSSQASEAEAEPEADNSLSLTLMNGLMDEVALHRAAEGTTVRLVKRLRLPVKKKVPSSVDASHSPRTTLPAMTASGPDALHQ